MRFGRPHLGDPKRPKRYRPVLQGLETRHLPATAVASLVVTPNILTPPNGRYVSVRVSGKVIESSKKATPSVQYHVIDEYALIQPQGSVAITKITPTVYSYSFKVVLQAQRSDSDKSGRQYNVIVGAQDSQNAQGLAVSVLVPHNKLKSTPAVQTSSVARMKTHHKK